MLRYEQSNLGRLNGAAILLEGYLETVLLFLPCRHHIAELILGCTFELFLPETTGPDVGIFQKSWDDIDKNNYKNGLIGQRLHYSLKPRIKQLDIYNSYLLQCCRGMIIKNFYC